MDHGRLYVAMAQKLLDRSDIVAQCNRCIANEWLLRVKSRRRRGKIHYQPSRAIWVRAPGALGAPCVASANQTRRIAD